MKLSALLLLSLLSIPSMLPAQRVATVRAGMTEVDVRNAFGAPATVRTAGDWTYLFYHNRCPRRCGSDDVVFLRDGQVVAAVLRTPARRYSGPEAAQALSGLGAAPSAPNHDAAAPSPPRSGARVEGIRIEVPGTSSVSVGTDPNTTRPSVVGPFPGRTETDQVGPATPTRDRNRGGVPLAPPETIDFSQPSGTGVPLAPPDTIDFTDPSDGARSAPRPAATRPR